MLPATTGVATMGRISKPRTILLPGQSAASRKDRATPNTIWRGRAVRRNAAASPPRRLHVFAVPSVSTPPETGNRPPHQEAAHLFMRKIIIIAIRFYQLAISPWLSPRCRFIPSCSDYALEAVQKFGVLKGGAMAIKRILRCHPFGGHGFDPVDPAGCHRHRAGV